MTVFLTGAAGFIGSHTAKSLLERGDSVVGVDNLNDYYDPQLKRDRLARLQEFPAFAFYEADITDEEQMNNLIAHHTPEVICHLAAQAGVRYSLENPSAYIHSNIVGSAILFEAARRHQVPRVVFASSSSVYGNADSAPFHEGLSTDHPISLYAATKKSKEVIAHSYYHLFGIQMTGLRFFTVYGPWGRPDMSPIKFARLISQGKPIEVYNHGKMQRDFTYIDDIVDGVIRAIDRPLGYRILNLGGSQVTELEHFISLLEKHLGKTAIKQYLPLQPGDVLLTSADVSTSKELLGWQPQVSLEEGVRRFCAWFSEYYGN